MVVMARKDRSTTPALEIRDGLDREYADLFTPEAMAALAALARFDPELGSE